MNQVAGLSSEAMLREARLFQTKKQLGQHFLIDAETLQQITDVSGATAGDTVVEIGPGAGFLTRYLVGTGANVVAIDLDREAVAYLREKDYPGVRVEHGDFLQMDLRSSAKVDRFKVVGNVPYQITGLILGHLLGEIGRPSPWLPRIENIVMTVQREVAQRMVAFPGGKDYSNVSMLVGYYCKASIERIIPPTSFFPKPKVTSALVRLTPRAEPRVKSSNPVLLRQVIRAGFKQRRKMLKNNLGFMHLPQEDINKIFSELRFDPQARAEGLSLEQFSVLTEAFNERLKHHGLDNTPSAGEDQPDA